jgi:hypothetical protein
MHSHSYTHVQVHHIYCTQLTTLLFQIFSLKTREPFIHDTAYSCTRHHKCSITVQLAHLIAQQLNENYQETRACDANIKIKCTRHTHFKSIPFLALWRTLVPTCTICFIITKLCIFSTYGIKGTCLSCGLHSAGTIHSTCW